MLIMYLIRWWRRRQAARAAVTSGAVVESPAAPAAAVAGSGAVPRVDGRSAASRGAFALLLHEALYDIKISARNPRERSGPRSQGQVEPAANPRCVRWR